MFTYQIECKSVNEIRKEWIVQSKYERNGQFSPNMSVEQVIKSSYIYIRSHVFESPFFKYRLCQKKKKNNGNDFHTSVSSIHTSVFIRSHFCFLSCTPQQFQWETLTIAKPQKQDTFFFLFFYEGKYDTLQSQSERNNFTKRPHYM